MILDKNVSSRSIIHEIFFKLTSDISVLFKYGKNILAMTMWHNSKATMLRARIPCMLLNPSLVGETNRDLKFVLIANDFLSTRVIRSIRGAVRSTSAIIFYTKYKTQFYKVIIHKTNKRLIWLKKNCTYDRVRRGCILFPVQTLTYLKWKLPRQTVPNRNLLIFSVCVSPDTCHFQRELRRVETLEQSIPQQRPRHPDRKKTAHKHPSIP
jgi:hypothetical protein